MRPPVTVLLHLAALCLVLATNARELSAPVPDSLQPIRRLQISIAIDGTCQDTKLNGFNAIFQNSALADVQAFVNVPVTVTGKTAPACRDVKRSGNTNDQSPYASFIARLQWRSTSTSALKTLFQSANRLRPQCRVGISQQVFPTVFKAVADAGKTIYANAAMRQLPIMAYVTPCTKDIPAPSPSPSPAPVPVDCVGAWSEYSACNVTACGQSGYQVSKFNITTPAANGGKPCDHQQNEVRLLACNTTACPPPPANCTGIPDSLLDVAENKCKCIKTGFKVPALNKTGQIMMCLPDSTVSCPATYPVAVKDSSTSVVKVVSCLTQDSSCPPPYTFPLWGGKPSLLKECRTPIPGCGYQGYGLPVYDGLDPVNPVQLGCVALDSNACPFVAYRSAGKGWAMEDCRKITACPQYTKDSTSFTVPSYAADGRLMSCLTLGADNGCPLESPIEVFLGSALNCGSDTLPCTFASGASRTVRCLSTTVTCPPDFPLELWKVSGSPAVSELVQCRQARQTCDLTASGMGSTSNDADANAYGVEIWKADLLAGCLLSNPAPAACPERYPKTTRVAGIISECRPPDGTQVTCPSDAPVPVRDIAGNIVDCITKNDPCPATNPVTVRTGTQVKVQCLASGSSCPADYSFGFYAPAGDGKSTVLTNCFKPEDILVTANPQCTVSVIEGPISIQGKYGKPIRSNSTGTLRLLGCMLDSTSVCPTAFSFGVYAGTQLSECRSSTGISGCEASQVPARNQGVLSACATVDTTCPDAFPVEVRDAVSGGRIVECVTTTTKCTQTSQKFTLIIGEILDGCVPPTPGQSQCANGLEVYSPDGNSLIGCVTGTKCPSLFPITLFSTDGVTAEACQESLAGTCSMATSGDYPITLYSTANTVAGCIKKGATGCGGATGRVVVSIGATDPPQACYPETTTGCSFSPYTFPLYGGVMVAKLERCILPISATSCAGVSTYLAAIYSTLDGSGNVAGCIGTSSPCPIGAPLAFLAATGTLQGCRPQGVVQCPITHSVRLEQSSTALLGCMEATATSCPNSPATPVKAPFPLFGVGANNAAILNICRVLPLYDCSSVPMYPVEVFTGPAASPGNVVGCKANMAFCPTVSNTATIMFASGTGSSYSVDACYSDASCPINSVALCNDAQVSVSGTAVSCTNLKGCIALLSSNKRCPSALVGSPVTYPFFVADIESSSPSVAGASIKGCFRAGTTCPATAYTDKAHDSSSASSTVIGCTDETLSLCTDYVRLYKAAANDEVCSS